MLHGGKPAPPLGLAPALLQPKPRKPDPLFQRKLARDILGQVRETEGKGIQDPQLTCHRHLAAFRRQGQNPRLTPSSQLPALPPLLEPRFPHAETSTLQRQSLLFPNSLLQAPKPSDPEYAPHPQNSLGGSELVLGTPAPPRWSPAPRRHPTLPSCGRPPESPPLPGTQDHLPSSHPVPPLRLTAAPTPHSLPVLPGHSNPESAAASPPALPAPRSWAAAPASPQRSALGARPGGPVLPMPGAGAGGARLTSPRAPAPPAAAPLPPGPRPATLCQFRPRRGGSDGGGGRGRGAGGGFGEG